MSRWLQSVNTLLEQLDGKVETAVEDQIIRDEDEQQGVQTDVLEDILAKRGLSVEDVADEPDAIEKVAAAEGEMLEHKDIVTEGEGNVEEELGLERANSKQSISQSEEEGVEKETEESQQEVTLDRDANEGLVQETAEQAAKEESEHLNTAGSAAPTEHEDYVVDAEETADVAVEVGGTEAVEIADDREPSHALSEREPVVSEPTKPKEIAPPHASEIVFSKPDPKLEKDYKAALAEVREAQKEARTLRRHVVSLNSQLEAAEAEITAQRTELERAAERMERDRARHKEEKERQAGRHAEEIKSLKQQHDLNTAEHKARSDEQLEEARGRLREVEERRMQEGGDWTKELEEAIHRERAATRRVVMLEDEKSTLLTQVSTLQSQQAALESRMESIRETADNAMEREREAEDRLDSALSLHARQLSQRQARESELERTVADLGAALVVARNREINRLKTVQQEGSEGEVAGSGDTSLQAKLEAAEDELETVKAQLDLERQRCQTLHNELRDVSQERTEEASAAHARQLQHDRQIADMSLSISRLQASLRDSKKESFRAGNDGGSRASFAEEDEKSSQIKTLSEQVLRQQEKIGTCTSEISALKSRLRSALSRVESAELLASSGNSGGTLDLMERAPASGNTMRRRGVNRKGHDSFGGSIRSAMRLEPGQTEGKEKIGKAIDALDTFSVQTGKYLRHNPLARGAFLIYLILLHLWTFLLLVFHAHSFETVHGDFGTGRQLPHGPHALMQNADPAVTSSLNP